MKYVRPTFLNYTIVVIGPLIWLDSRKANWPDNVNNAIHINTGKTVLPSNLALQCHQRNCSPTFHECTLHGLHWDKLGSQILDPFEIEQATLQYVSLEMESIIFVQRCMR